MITKDKHTKMTKAMQKQNKKGDKTQQNNIRNKTKQKPIKI